MCNINLNRFYWPKRTRIAILVMLIATPVYCIRWYVIFIWFSPIKCHFPAFKAYCKEYLIANRTAFSHPSLTLEALSLNLLNLGSPQLSRLVKSHSNFPQLCFSVIATSCMLFISLSDNCSHHNLNTFGNCDINLMKLKHNSFKVSAQFLLCCSVLTTMLAHLSIFLQ